MTDICPPFNFVHSNRRVISAWQGVSKLGDLAREANAKSAAVVMDAFFENTEVAAQVCQLLQEATGSALAVHFVPAHEPDTATIEACRDALAACSPDFIVALGGGSAMDTAKVARLLLANPGTAESVSGFGKFFKPHASVLVAVGGRGGGTGVD